MKQITEEIYLDKARNGARVLFNVFEYRLLDGTKILEVDSNNYATKEQDSYFIIDFSEDTFYELTLKEAYDLLALYVCKDVKKERLIDCIEELLFENILN